MAQLFIDTRSPANYDLYLKIKCLPKFQFQGHTVFIPDEYLPLLGQSPESKTVQTRGYQPEFFLFDYQKAITALAIKKQKYAIFAQCGLGKSLILLSYARHVSRLNPSKCVLIVSPLMVVEQTIKEAKRFWGDYPIEQLRAKNLQDWLNKGSGIGITNYEAIRDGLLPGNLCSLILDESSCLKSHYGAWGQRLIEMGKGLQWKLCLTGTPAPNDRIEYANHAVFLDQFPTVNSFLARYFVNRGQTSERWELKPHALRPFYRSLSHWSIFLENPATYGWQDNVDKIPPIYVHLHDVDLTDDQRGMLAKVSGNLIGTAGGITSRAKLAQLAKGIVGKDRLKTNKASYIRNLVDSWKESESTIIWCRYNREQDDLEETFPEAHSVRGETKEADRLNRIADFQEGRCRILISKPDVLGFGLNFQCATRHVFNGLWDSLEEYHQAVKRSNRIGSTRPLNVHIPVTEIERAMVDTVLLKAKRMQQDIEEQEAIFKESAIV